MSKWNTDPNDQLADRLECIIRADTHLMQLLTVLGALDLPQWRVAAGCIYQTVWNALTGRPLGIGIYDYDVIYFDGDDLSRETETAVEGSVRGRLPTSPVLAEVRNQARVHFWFQDSYGIFYTPLSSADESITRYPSATHAVGVRLTDACRIRLSTIERPRAPRRYGPN
jgi:hypothetical protein